MMDETPSKRSGPIAWMAKNSVAANLLMIVFLLGGFLFAMRVKQEVFPSFDLDIINVSVPYPGASPEEVEKGIILVVEDEVRALDGVKKVSSIAVEGSGSVTIELLRGFSSAKMLQDVKNVVDRIGSFPEEAERPIVSLLEAQKQVISLVIYGNQDRKLLRELAEYIRDELVQIPGITLVELASVPPLEIEVEVPQKNLRAYNLTLSKIADTIRRTAIDLPAGAVKAPSGEVLLRTQERRDFASEFGDIPIVSQPDGSKVFLEEIADIQEGFEETNEEAFFNGLPAIRLNIFRVGDQTPLDISQKVRAYAEEELSKLPEGIDVAVWNDSSEIFRDRIDLLLRNAFAGLVLVLLLLGLFLEPRLAFWVTLGIPVSVIGSFLFFPATGASINMISLFAFLVTLGIVVDDAIVVGENIYQKREQGMSFKDAAIEGAQEIATPVTFAVLTNVAAFMPLFFVPGPAGKLFLQIPAIVVFVILVSLTESLFVLPAHLTHEHKKSKFWDLLTLPSLRFEKVLNRFIQKQYTPSLKAAIQNRYLTLTTGMCMLVLTFATIIGGHIRFSFIPRVDADIATVHAILPFGVPIEKARAVQKQIVDAAKVVIEEEGDISKGIYTQIGSAILDMGPPTGVRSGEKGSHLVAAQVALVEPEERNISGVAFANAWREMTGEIPGVETISFSAMIGTTGGNPIDIELSHGSTEVIEAAAKELAFHLKDYSGVSDIHDGVSLGKPQMSFQVTPEARSLGITARDLAEQVRSAFYGAEALRQQRGRNEVKVMVRLPEEERKTVYTAEEMILRTPEGGEIPLSDAAQVKFGRSYTSIKRVDGRRILSVTADVDEGIANSNEIVGDVQREVLPGILQKYPGLSYKLAGQQQEQSDTLGALAVGFAFAMLAIYAMLAIPFRSYIQPLIVMLSIPFGIIGAILGHLLLGYELSIMSMFGIVALSGVVINDALVFIVTINRYRKEGMTPFNAVMASGPLRFRPIILTSLTTFFGLAPMIFETSMQAKFLIPMAISLGFGVLFATAISLLLIPAAYLIVEDTKS